MWQELLIKSIMLQLPTEVECEYFVDLEKLENAFLRAHLTRIQPHRCLRAAELFTPMALSGAGCSSRWLRMPPERRDWMVWLGSARSCAHGTYTRVLFGLTGSLSNN